jgi:hypothetical protein
MYDCGTTCVMYFRQRLLLVFKYMFSSGCLDRGVSSGLRARLAVGHEPVVTMTVGALGWSIHETLLVFKTLSLLC